MVIMSKALMATSAGPISLDSCQTITTFICGKLLILFTNYLGHYSVNHSQNGDDSQNGDVFVAVSVKFKIGRWRIKDAAHQFSFGGQEPSSNHHGQYPSIFYNIPMMSGTPTETSYNYHDNGSG